MFADLHVILLTRRDRVRQAVSWARAAQDGVWVVSDTEPPAPSGEPTYSYELIAGLEGLIAEGERGWRDLCLEVGVEPHEVVYEDLVSRHGYEATILSILRHLGVGDPSMGVPPPRTHCQADDLNDDWVEQYAADRAVLEQPQPPDHPFARGHAG